MRICLGIVAADGGTDPLGGPADRGAAAQDVGLPARGTRALPADERPRPARLLRLAVRDGARSGAARRGRLAGPVPDPRVRRASRRGAVEGQPAEGPVHRRGPPRPRGPADGRAVHGARPGQPHPPARGIRRAARPRPDRHLLDPPDGDGRGDVRIGRDRRPRAPRRGRPRARPQAGERAANVADRDRRRPVADLAGRRCPMSVGRGRTPAVSSSSSCRRPIRRRSSQRSSIAVAR